MDNQIIKQIRYIVGEAWKGPYDRDEEYNVAGVVQDPTGLSIYRSRKSGNVGHPLSDPVWWFCIIDLSSIKSASDAIDALNRAIAEDETLRVLAENARVLNENGRIDAEALRVAAETGRASSETQREANETTRQSNETQRQTAETARGTAETARQTKETQREAAETLRDRAESERSASENSRKAAETERNTQFGTDHGVAVQDHTQAAADHTLAVQDHTTAAADHTTAETDHTRAGQDHETASTDHTRAEADHTTAAADHTAAAQDHTQAGEDHSRAETDHARAEQDHTNAAGDHAVVEGYNTRLTNVEGEVEELGQAVEELLLGSHDHMAAAWAEEQVSPAAVKTAGDMGLVNFDFFLIDHTRNTDERSEPVGTLKRNNILRFADGRFAPAVGITAAQAAECMGNDLYLNGELYAAAGAYDPEAFYLDHCTWEAGLDDVVRLTHPVLRKGSAQGDEVDWYLMPWETTSKDYSIMLGHHHQLYYAQNVKGTSGRVWNFITTAPKTWDGLEPVPVAPSAFSPSPVAVITDNSVRKSRCAFYAYDGESAVNGNGGAGDSGGLSTLLRNTGKTFPASSVMSQITTMQYARNNNSDPTRNYPFAEGGWALYNLFVTWLEIKYGTRNLAAPSKFQSGISANDSCSNESNWRANGGVRCRAQGGDSWEYKGWAAASAILKKNANGDAPSNWSAFLNNYRPKEACMESQLAASFALEAGVAEGVEFEMYGETYTWESVSGTDNLEHGHMNAVIRSIRKGTIDAYDASGNATVFDVEFCLRMSLYEGANLSGDIYRYWGGGLEMIGTCTGTTDGHSGDPVDFFFEPDQKKWVTDTEYSHNNGAPFVAEAHYEKLGAAKVLGNAYSLADVPMTPWPAKSGGGFSQGMCHYCYCATYWSKTLGARVRIGVRFAGYANYGYCAPRHVYGSFHAGYTFTFFGGSAQVLIGESAAAPQAQ